MMSISSMKEIRMSISTIGNCSFGKATYHGRNIVIQNTMTNMMESHKSFSLDREGKIRKGYFICAPFDLMMRSILVTCICYWIDGTTSF